MKIYYKDILSNKEGIHKEILNTSDREIFKTETREDEQGEPYWEVSLLVNGVEMEVNYFNSMFKNTESWIEQRAEKMVQEKMQDNLWEVETEFRKISDVFESVKSKLIEDFNIEEDEY